MYSNQEMVDMLECYFTNGKIATRAKEAYGRQFPNRRIPGAGTFIRIVQRLRDHGTLSSNMVDNGRARSRAMEATVDNILDEVQQHPETSTRRLALRYNVSQSTVDRSLRDHGLYPYHVQKVQALLPADLPKRIQFSQWLLRKHFENSDFLRYVLFTDEAGFTREGIFNSHNTHIWAVENPRAIREIDSQHRFGVNMWAGIVDNKLIGPQELSRRLTAAEYLHFLQNYLDDLLEDVPLLVIQNLWLQQDGAPPHSSRAVTDWLNVNFNGRWIGRYGPVSWPPRSPDLNPCDFFLWGFMKQLVYSSAVDNVDDLRSRVASAARHIQDHPDLLENVRHSIVRRARACLDADGGHFEHLL